MIIECLTITLIILMMSFIFLRSKRPNYALVTLPLLSVPVFYLIGQFVAYLFLTGNQTGIDITLLSSILIGLLVRALFVGMLIWQLGVKKARATFATISAVFMVALSVVLMVDVVV